MAKRRSKRAKTGSANQLIKSATEHIAQGNLSGAAKVLDEGIENGNVDAQGLHLRAIVASEMQDYATAEKMIRTSLHLDPYSGDRLVDLGNILDQMGRTDDAVANYRKALQVFPSHRYAARNLALTLVQQGNIDEAIDAYQQQLKNSPNDATSLFEIGNLYTKQGDMDAAIESYQSALEQDQGKLEVYPAFFNLLRSSGQMEDAQNVLDAWLEQEPRNPIAQHMRATLQKEPPPRASDDYVREVFDEFAPTFEADLSDLGYRAPSLINELLRSKLGEPQEDLRVLDAGCGTGLCGPFLKPFAKELVGVDLSSDMISIAIDKAVYDKLEVGEIDSWLEASNDEFDLIVAADTLIYIGDLSRLVRNMKAAIARPGHLIFTAEVESEDSAANGFKLNNTGRYTHKESYLNEVLQQAGWKVESVDFTPIRSEAEKQVPSMLVHASC